MSGPIESGGMATPEHMEELRRLAAKSGEEVPENLPAAEVAQRIEEIRSRGA